MFKVFSVSCFLCFLVGLILELLLINDRSQFLPEAINDRQLSQDSKQSSCENRQYPLVVIERILKLRSPCRYLIGKSCPPAPRKPGSYQAGIARLAFDKNTTLKDPGPMAPLCTRVEANCLIKDFNHAFSKYFEKAKLWRRNHNLLTLVRQIV